MQGAAAWGVSPPNNYARAEAFSSAFFKAFSSSTIQKLVGIWTEERVYGSLFLIPLLRFLNSRGEFYFPAKAVLE